jgi:hypothetical protein
MVALIGRGGTIAWPPRLPDLIPLVFRVWGYINPLAYYFFTQKMVSSSIYNLKIDTIYMYDIPFDRSFLQLSNGTRHVMPSTDTKPELTAKSSMAQPVSQPAVYANGLMTVFAPPLSTNFEDLQALITEEVAITNVDMMRKIWGEIAYRWDMGLSTA